MNMYTTIPFIQYCKNNLSVKPIPLCYLHIHMNKSHIRETPNISTNADSSTATIFSAVVAKGADVAGGRVAQ